MGINWHAQGPQGGQIFLKRGRCHFLVLLHFYTTFSKNVPKCYLKCHKCHFWKQIFERGHKKWLEGMYPSHPSYAHVWWRVKNFLLNSASLSPQPKVQLRDQSKMYLNPPTSLTLFTLSSLLILFLFFFLWISFLFRWKMVDKEVGVTIKSGLEGSQFMGYSLYQGLFGADRFFDASKVSI